jgi:hypothetical protein
MYAWISFDYDACQWYECNIAQIRFEHLPLANDIYYKPVHGGCRMMIIETSKCCK